MSDIRLVVCGLSSEMVVIGLRNSNLECYLEPVAENTDQLRLMTEGADPLIRGGRPLVFVMADSAGPPADVAAWLSTMSVQPSEQVAIVLLDTGKGRDFALPALEDRVTVHDWAGADAEPRSMFETVADVLAALPGGPGSAPKRVAEPHVLVVAGTRGGVGCSTVAFSLGAYLGAEATAGRKVCLVDLDLSCPALAAMTSTPTSSRRSLLLEQRITLNTINEHVTPLPAWRIDLVPGATAPLESRFVPPAAIATTLDRLAEHYDLVVVDAGRLRWDLDGPERAIIECASQILLVADPARGQANGLADLPDTLCGAAGHGFPPRHVGLVWNRVPIGDAPFEIPTLDGLGFADLQRLPDIGDAHVRAVAAGDAARVLHDNASWAARIHLLGEAVVGPGHITPISSDVADLLPTLQRNGTPRTETRTRRKFLARIRFAARAPGAAS
ncbi:AAA family ATPase [Crossiella cryophila]|uniref:Mrp family chromosome partitioning ATPase n=1 Tax=Crossiella cryophila TaxID=43355 RepID=A0A7W7CII1_9PSEU|nr:P-loop NTPase [Crossiella cryophila]MBB4681839.1 Mrp family chromosome partitioning ATPase [Crossiella cryophila]